ncbi:hypothetical protein [Sphingomonas sp. PP-CC-3A-396]|uniref:hypothetical protein n=1 Tax=Sphingomonas sp. PP-CC-3A-396 TaxID=2135655 RepID=UPI00105138C2|nr:hypothetical protein [Sphingomonas sp. PP-CC-3A-396]TCQ06222.1 hypothetical protein C8J40_1057 [Sphingomonas sp. PP-CC-3A-396]
MAGPDQEYSTVGSKLRPFQITEPMFTAMGRLLRACADIENVVTMHLGRLGGFSEGQLLVLIGRSSITKKVKAARQFALAHGPDQVATHDMCFDNHAFRAIIRGRNVAAHGVLLGLTDDDRVAFRIETEPKVDSDMVSIETLTFAQDAFATLAATAESAVPRLKAELELKPAFEAREGLGLHPSRKAKSTQTRKRDA